MNTTDNIDAEYTSFDKVDPIQLLHSLMNDHNMKAKDLVELLGITKVMFPTFSIIKKGLSKEVIRKLAVHFKLAPRHLTGIIR